MTLRLKKICYMYLRNKYYAYYRNSEEEFVNFLLKYIKSSFFIRCYKKYSRNFWLHIIKIASGYIKPEKYEGFFPFYTKYDARKYRSLPISLKKEEIITSLKKEYQDNTVNLSYIYSKDLKATPKEKEEMRQESQKNLKLQYQYLLDLIEKINNNKNEDKRFNRSP